MFTTSDIPEQVIRDIVGAYHRRLELTKTESQDEKERDFQRYCYMRTALEWVALWANEAQPQLDRLAEAVETKCDGWWGRDKETGLQRLFRAGEAIPADAVPWWNVGGIHGGQPQPAPYNGWYCAHCQTGVDSRDVTFSEQHTVCGRVITDDEPPQPAPSGTEPATPDSPAYVTLSEYSAEVALNTLVKLSEEHTAASGVVGPIISDLRIALCRPWKPSEKQPAPEGMAMVPEKMPAEFSEWLCSEMRPRTVISNPAWWAPKIYRAAIAAAKVKP